MQDNPVTVIVIGGGAAGMVAAITAARNGANTLILERMSRVGKKLLATGNGRCNLTNLTIDEEKYHGTSGKFALNVIKQFDVEKTLAFFKQLGLETYEEAEGRIFPITNQASSVLDLLRYEMNRLNVAEVCDCRVNEIERQEERFLCLCTNGHRYYADRVIIAAGGKSSPNLGSNGGGYKLAEAWGHQVIAPFPSLVQVLSDSPYLKSLQGVKINGNAGLYVSEKLVEESFGEILFADYGLSGLPILHISRHVSALEEPRTAVIRLNLFPELTNSDLIDLIQERGENSPEKTVSFSFVGMLNKRLIDVVLKEARIKEPDKDSGSLSREEISRIAKTMQNLSFLCTGTRSWMYSQVTAGGISTKEIDRRTLESRKASGIFFAGEVVDVDGDSGGYNLQWAWSSGFVAGTFAAQRL